MVKEKKTSVSWSHVTEPEPSEDDKEPVRMACACRSTNKVHTYAKCTNGWCVSKHEQGPQVNKVYKRIQNRTRGCIQEPNTKRQSSERRNHGEHSGESNSGRIENSGRTFSILGNSGKLGKF
eukprot:750350-Prorocentrum_minimum.AAC.3